MHLTIPLNFAQFKEKVTRPKFATFWGPVVFVLTSFLISSGSHRPTAYLQDRFTPEKINELAKRFTDGLIRQQAPPQFWAAPNKNPSLTKIDGFQVVPDSNRRIEAIVFHGGGYSADVIAPIIKALRSDIHVVILTPFTQADPFQIYTRIKEIPGIEKRLTFVPMSSVETAWARDPYIVLFKPEN